MTALARPKMLIYEDVICQGKTVQSSFFQSRKRTDAKNQ